MYLSVYKPIWFRLHIRLLSSVRLCMYICISRKHRLLLPDSGYKLFPSRPEKLQFAYTVCSRSVLATKSRIILKVCTVLQRVLLKGNPIKDLQN